MGLQGFRQSLSDMETVICVVKGGVFTVEI